jgi:hypothetical protein
MTRIGKAVATLLALACTAGLPAGAFARGALSGMATGEGDGPLPGVTVEASSPALIERVRSTLTDAAQPARSTSEALSAQT